MESLFSCYLTFDKKDIFLAYFHEQARRWTKYRTHDGKNLTKHSDVKSFQEPTDFQKGLF